jgi:hypothetical protein
MIRRRPRWWQRVGWRTALDGRLILLVQNWWMDKQFFEADLSYLASRRARLTWITDKYLPFPSDLFETAVPYAEVHVTGTDGP